MPLPVVGAGILHFLRTVFGGVVFGKFFGWVKSAFKWAFGKGGEGAEGKKGIFGKLFGIFEALLSGAAIMTVVVEGIKRFLGYLGLGGAVISGGANVNQMWHLLENVADPQAAVLDWLAEALSHLPSLQQLIAQLDSLIMAMPVLSHYVSPVPTFTNVLQITGVGAAFNQILMSCVQNMIFIFSVFIVRWAFSSNFTFTKSVNRRQRT